MTRLVVDLVLRLRWMYVYVALLMTLVWSVLSSDGDATWPLRLVLIVGFGIGPIVGLTKLAPNTSLLPLSRVEVWHAQWIVAVLLPVVPTVAGWSLGYLFGLAGFLAPRVGPSTLLIVVVAQVAYAAIGLVPAIILRRSKRDSGWRATAADVIAMAALLGCFVWGFFVAEYVPLHWSGADSSLPVFLVVALVLTISTYFYRPAPLPRPPWRPLPHVRPPHRARNPRRAGFTGLPRLAAREMLIAGGGIAGMLLLFSAVDLVTAGPPEGAWWPGLTAILAVSHVNVRSLARALRVLPMSGRGLGWLLTVLPLLRWSAMLSVALVFGRIGGYLGAWGVGLVLGCIGLTTLAEAIFWRYGNAWGMHASIFAAVLLMNIGRMLGEKANPSSAALIVIGVMSVLLAATINQRTMTATTGVFRTRIPMRPA